LEEFLSDPFSFFWIGEFFFWFCSRVFLQAKNPVRRGQPKGKEGRGGGRRSTREDKGGRGGGREARKGEGGRAREGGGGRRRAREYEGRMKEASELEVRRERGARKIEKYLFLYPSSLHLFCPLPLGRPLSLPFFLSFYLLLLSLPSFSLPSPRSLAPASTLAPPSFLLHSSFPLCFLLLKFFLFPHSNMY
jgi:hypothetical protein